MTHSQDDDDNDFSAMKLTVIDVLSPQNNNGSTFARPDDGVEVTETSCEPRNKSSRQDPSLLSDLGSALPLYFQPRQRQRWTERPQYLPPNWTDLFLDTAYVAAAYAPTQLLTNDPSPRGLLYFVACCFPVMVLWQSKLYFDARFYVNDDIFHRVYEIAILVSLATAASNCVNTTVLANVSYRSELFVYCVSLLVAAGLNVGRYVEIWVCCARPRSGSDASQLFPEAFFQSRRDVTYNGAPLVFLCAAAVVAKQQYVGGSEIISVNNIPAYLLLAFCASSAIVTIIMYLGAFRGHLDVKSLTIPLNIEYCIHRYGVWTMLILGLNVFSLLGINEPKGQGYYWTFWFSIVTLILLHYLHSQYQPPDLNQHALRHSKLSAALFSLSFQIYSAALFILGASYVLFLYDFVYAAEAASATINPVHRLDAASRILDDSVAAQLPTTIRRQRVAYFFTISLAVSWFCLDAASVAHLGVGGLVDRYQSTLGAARWTLVASVAIRVGLLAAIIIVGHFEQRPVVLTAVGLCCVTLQLLVRALGWATLPSIVVDNHDGSFDMNASYASASLPGLPKRNWSISAVKFVQTESLYDGLPKPDPTTMYLRESNGLAVPFGRRFRDDGTLEFVSAHGEESMVDFHSVPDGTSVVGSNFEASSRRYRDSSMSEFASAFGGSSTMDFSSARGGTSNPSEPENQLLKQNDPEYYASAQFQDDDEEEEEDQIHL